MDKMREEFETWLDASGYRVERAGGGYKYDSINIAWLSWKASRAALCVELPSGLTEKQFTKIAEQIENLGGEWE